MSLTGQTPWSVDEFSGKCSHAVLSTSSGGLETIGRTQLGTKFKHECIRISGDGCKMYYAGQDGGGILTSSPVHRASGVFYYEVEVGSWEVLDLTRLPTNIRALDLFRDVSLGFSSTPGGFAYESYYYHSFDGKFTSGMAAMADSGQLYGPSFDTRDIIGCGIDFVAGCLFFVKNRRYLGMVPILIKDTQTFYPAIAVASLRALTLEANFGQRPFKCLTEDVLRAFASQRHSIELISHLPGRWAYTDNPLLEVSEDRSLVHFAGSTLPSGPAYGQPGVILRTDLPIPPRIEFFYFEVKLVHTNHNAISIGFTAGDANLNHMLGLTAVGPERCSYGLCSKNGLLSYAGRTTAYCHPFEDGDVVGCGVHFLTGQIFYTKNGVRLGADKEAEEILRDPSRGSKRPHFSPAFLNVKVPKSGLFPAISFGNGPATVSLACGQESLAYDVKHHLAEAAAITQSAARIASHYPEELIDIILDYACRPTMSLLGNESSRELIHAIGSYRLVSRFWDRQCRQQLFKRVALGSVARTDALLDIMKGSPGPFPIESLFFAEDYPSWMLIALSKLAHKCPDVLSISLVNIRELNRKKLYHSTPPRLSGRLPALLQLFTNVQHLRLKNLYFQSAQVVIHLISSLHNLRALSVEGVAWKIDPPHSGHFHCQPRQVHAMACTDNTMFLSVMMTRVPEPIDEPTIGNKPRKHPLPSIDISRGESQIVKRLTEVLRPVSRPGDSLEVGVDDDKISHSFVIAHVTMRAIIHHSIVIAFQLVESPNGFEQSYAICGVKIHVELDTVEDIVALRWEQICECLASLPSLVHGDILIGLRERGFEEASGEFKALREVILDRMQQMETLGKLTISALRPGPWAFPALWFTLFRTIPKKNPVTIVQSQFPAPDTQPMSPDITT